MKAAIAVRRPRPPVITIRPELRRELLDEKFRLDMAAMRVRVALMDQAPLVHMVDTACLHELEAQQDQRVRSLCKRYRLASDGSA
jgi:hypothetical protein